MRVTFCSVTVRTPGTSCSIRLGTNSAHCTGVPAVSSPLQRDDAETCGRRGRSGAAACRPEADDKNVRSFNRHRAPHAAQARRPARPLSAIEQQA